MSFEWNHTTWGDVSTLEYGKALRNYKNATGKFPVYGTNGLIGYHDKALCETPGVIIGRKGAYRGVHYSSRPFFVIDTAFYLNPKVPIDMRWVYYALLTCDINGMDSGSAIPSTSREEFYKLSALVPPLSVQKQIANLLELLDNRITLLRETNATLEAIAQALFKSWFVDFDPVRAKAEGRVPEGMDASTAALFPEAFDMSELGLVPEGWLVKAIGDAVEALGGGTPDTKTPEYWEPPIHNWTTPKDLSGLTAPVLLRTERKLSDAGIRKVSSGLLPAGTLLMSSRAPIGYLAISNAPVAINQGYIAIPPDGELSPLFMLFWCKANMENIKARANGSTFMEISKKAFKPIPALVASAAVLNLFEAVASSLFSKIICNEEKIQSLATLRDTLLPRLISGQLRIADAEAELEKATA